MFRSIRDIFLKAEFRFSNSLTLHHKVILLMFLYCGITQLYIVHSVVCSKFTATTILLKLHTSYLEKLNHPNMRELVLTLLYNLVYTQTLQVNLFTSSIQSLLRTNALYLHGQGNVLHIRFFFQVRIMYNITTFRSLNLHYSYIHIREFIFYLFYTRVGNALMIRAYQQILFQVYYTLNVYLLCSTQLIVLSTINFSILCK